jgi:hypothetical protein
MDRISSHALDKIEVVLDFFEEFTADELSVAAHALTLLALTKEGVVTQGALMNRAARIGELHELGFITDTEIERINRKIAEVT